MKTVHYYFLTGCILFGIAATICSRAASSILPLTLTPNQFELGDVAQGRFVTATMMITNNSRKTIHIADAVTGCGCTTVKPPRELIPGKPTPITVQYDTDGPLGEVHKGLTLFFVERPYKPLQLNIIGKVHEEIRITPANVTTGTVNGGDTISFAFDSTRLDGKPLSIQPADIPSTTKLKIVQKGTNIVHVSGTLLAPKLPNDYADIVRFYTNDDALPKIETQVSYTVRPRFIITPQLANFGVISSTGSAQMSLAIHGNASVRLQLVPSGIQAKLVEQKSDPGYYQLIVSLTKRGEGKILSERLTLATDDPKQPQIIIPIYAVTRR